MEAARFSTRTGSMPCGLIAVLRSARTGKIRLNHVECARSFAARQCIHEDDRVPGIEQGVSQIETPDTEILDRHALG